MFQPPKPVRPPHADPALMHSMYQDTVLSHTRAPQRLDSARLADKVAHIPATHALKPQNVQQGFQYDSTKPVRPSELSPVKPRPLPGQSPKPPMQKPTRPGEPPQRPQIEFRKSKSGRAVAYWEGTDQRVPREDLEHEWWARVLDAQRPQY